jgi:hypothetical protein
VATPAAIGAYGLRLADLPDARELLLPAPPHWAEWRIERVVGERPAEAAIDGDTAAIPLHGSGSIAIDRARTTAMLTAPRPPGDAELVHPYLGAIGAVVARWLGHQSFHCGGALIEGGTWGILGDREQGKSTLLASLSSRGVGVMSDDLLVVRQERMAAAGPRCVDLRSDAAEALALGESIGVVGARERWRVKLEPVEPEAPLTGWVALGWGPDVAVRPVPPAERLPRLLSHATIVPEPVNPADLLDLAALPMLVLERPRGFDALPSACDALLEATAAK